MRTRNSAKSSPPPKKTQPARRAAAEKPSVSISDSAPAPAPAPAPKPQRETRRQAAIKAKQALAMLNDNPPPQPHDAVAVDVSMGAVAAAEVMPQASSSGKAVAKKGTKRTRGPAKGNPPATQRIKSEVEENTVDGNADVRRTGNVTDVQEKEGNITNEIVQMNIDDKEDAPPAKVTNVIVDTEATQIDLLAVNDVGELSNVHVKEEQDKETIETKNHLDANSGEFCHVLKTENYSEVETIARFSENEEKKRIPMEEGNTAKSEALIVDETLTGPVIENIGCQPASTGEHTIAKTGEDTKVEGSVDLNGDIMVGVEVQHDHDILKETEETNTSDIDEDPEELADVEEETLNEMAGNDKRIAHLDGAFCNSGVRNSEVNDANNVDTLAMGNNNTHKDHEQVKKVEKDEKPGRDTDGIDGDGKKYENENDQGSDAEDAVKCFTGIESSKNHGLINDLIEKSDELKVDKDLERNTRDSVVDREWIAVAKSRRIKKEHEIFIRGVGGDMKEDDLKKVFEAIGEVVEVRFHKQSMLNKSKGYAFVRFADKEHVKRALTKIKDPVIGGVSCSIGPSEDNDTLFLGNVCNTWTKEEIKQKLKDYGVEGVENITLVPDAQREGFCRGFAFVEFSCHDEAVAAYQRLQKPDVVFGHAERTAKVAFAEPLRDPDPDVMLKVKTVFVDGLPSICDEQYVREKVRSFGEIERVVLARNMTTAKRKDFGFIHFTTHEAAVACIDSINSIGLDDRNAKTKIKARLSNPLPKTQAVKGGMAGGFRIVFSSVGGASKPGTVVGRDGHLYRQGDSARGPGLYQHRYGQPDRVGFSSDYHHDTRFSSHVSGQGSRVGFRPRGVLSVTVRPFIPNHVRPVRVPGDTSHGVHSGPVDQFHFDGGFGRHHNLRHIDDSRAYGHGAHGTKRPLYMTDVHAAYVEPNRRPYLSCADPPYPTAPPYSSQETQTQAAQGPLSNIQPHNYYWPPVHPRPRDYYGPTAYPHPLDYYGPPANPRPHDYYGPPASARPRDYYGPPASACPRDYGPPTHPRPHDYYEPRTGIRPPEYYRPTANIRPHAHSVPDFTGVMCPPAYRGNPPYGGGFHY